MSSNGDNDPKDLDTTELEDLLEAIEGWSPDADKTRSLGDHLSGGGAGPRRLGGPLYKPAPESAPPTEEDLSFGFDGLDEGAEWAEDEGAPTAVESPHRGEPIVPAFVVTIGEDGGELAPSDDEHVQIDAALLGVDGELEAMLGDLLPEGFADPEAAGWTDAAESPAGPLDDFVVAGPSQGDGSEEANTIEEPLPLSFGDAAGWRERPTPVPDGEPTPLPELPSTPPPAPALIPLPLRSAPSRAPASPPPPEPPVGLGSPVAVPSPPPAVSPSAPPTDGPRSSPAPAVLVGQPPVAPATPVPTISVERPAVSLEQLAGVVEAGAEEPGDLAPLLDRLSSTAPPRLAPLGEALPSLEELVGRLGRAHEVDREPAPPVPLEELASRCELAALSAASTEEAVDLLCGAGLLAERRLGETGKAYELYGRAVELAPGSGLAVTGRRRTALALRRLEGLEELVRAELRLDPAREERLELLLLLKELALSRAEDLSAAAEALHEAAALAPDDLGAILGLAELAFVDGDHDAFGARALEASRLVHDAELRAALELGAARSAELMGELEPALERYQAAAELAPSSPSALAGLARTSAATGANAAAARALVELGELFAPGAAASAFRRRAASLLLAAGEAVRATEVLAEGGDRAEWATVLASANAAGATSLASRALRELALATDDPVLRASRLAAMILLAEDFDTDRVGAMLDELVPHPSAGLLASVAREELSRSAGDLASMAAAESEGAGRGGAIRAAVMLSARGRPGDARRCFVAAREDRHTESEAGLALGVFAAAAQDWPGLAEILHGAADRAELPALRASSMLHLGQVHELRTGDRVAARAAYGHAQEADPGLLPALAGLRRTAPDAIARHGAARREAEATGGRLVAAGLHLLAGAAAEEAGDPAAALEACSAALACEPANETALAAMARLLRERGSKDEPVEAWAVAAGSLADRSAALHRVRIARAALGRGEIGAAEDALRLAIEARPGAEDLAAALVRVPCGGEPSAALADRLEGASTLLQADRRAAALVAAAEAAEPFDPERALACLDRAREASPERQDLDLHLERVLTALGRIDELEARLLPAEGEAPEWVAVAGHQRLAELARLAEDEEAELRHREAIVRAAPSDLPSLHWLARRALRQGPAESLPDRLVALAGAVEDERQASALILLAVRLRGLSADDPIGPIELARLAVDKAPDDLRALLHLHLVATARGEVDQAARAAASLAGVLGLPRCRAVFDLRAADAYEEMGRFDDALDHLLRAGKEGAHPAGFWRGSRLAEKIGKRALAAEMAEATAELSAAAGQKARELLRAARLWYEDVSDLRKAMLALQRSLAVNPSAPAALELARKILQEDADPRLALDLVSELLGGVSDPAELVELASRAADLALELGEVAGAKEHLRAVLQADPEHVGALGRLTELASQDGEWHEAAQCSIRLARISQSAEEAKAHFFRLGVIYHEKLPDQRRAIQSFRKVLSIDPEHLPALRRLAALLPLAGEWQAACELTARLASSEVDEDRRRAALLLLARGYEEGLSDSRRAEAALDEARRLGPTDMTAVAALADFYKRQGARQALVVHLDRAAADFRRVLDDDPCDLAAYHSLFQVFALRGAEDAARCAATVLATFGEADAGEEDLIARLGGAGWRPGPNVADIGLDDHLCPAALTPSLRSLFAHVGEPAARLWPQDPRRLGLARGDRLARGNAVFEAAQSLAPWYGLKDVEVWLHPSRTEAWHVIAGPPPAIVLGAGFAEAADEATIRFLLARGMALLQRRLALLTQLEPAEVALLLMGVVKLVYPGYEAEGLDEAKLAETTRELGRVLGKRVRQEVGPFAVECVGDLRVVPAELPARALDLGDRVGLLAAGTLSSALHALGRVGGTERASTSGRELLACVEETPRSAGLLRFFVSAAHVAVRERLGTSGPV